MNSDLPISVVIPVFNRAALLPETFASLVAQSSPPDEVLLVDNGSTDDSARVAQVLAAGAPFDTRVLTHTVARGIAPARNHGIAAARHPWIALLDSDDLWAPDKLESQRAALAARPGALYATTGFEEFFCPGYTPRPGEQLKATAGVLSGSLVAHRTLFATFGLFDESLRVGEFIEWMSRVRAAAVPGIHLDRPLLRRRVHGANSVRDREAYSDYLRVVRQALRRRQAPPGA